MLHDLQSSDSATICIPNYSCLNSSLPSSILSLLNPLQSTCSLLFPPSPCSEIVCREHHLLFHPYQSLFSRRPCDHPFLVRSIRSILYLLSAIPATRLQPKPYHSQHFAAFICLSSYRIQVKRRTHHSPDILHFRFASIVFRIPR